MNKCCKELLEKIAPRVEGLPTEIGLYIAGDTFADVVEECKGELLVVFAGDYDWYEFHQIPWPIDAWYGPIDLDLLVGGKDDDR